MNKYIAPGFALLFASALFVDPAMAQMINPLDNPNEIAQVTGNDGSLRQMILKYINFFLYFLGLVATAFVIYGGFLYITSQGEDGNVEKAKKILTFAAIGIFIILISFALINTVLTAGTGLQSATL
jgi:hypothetical protein